MTILPLTGDPVTGERPPQSGRRLAAHGVSANDADDRRSSGTPVCPPRPELATRSHFGLPCPTPSRHAPTPATPCRTPGDLYQRVLWSSTTHERRGEQTPLHRPVCRMSSTDLHSRKQMPLPRQMPVRLTKHVPKAGRAVLAQLLGGGLRLTDVASPMVPTTNLRIRVGRAIALSVL
jgi:hypothetical protein